VGQDTSSENMAIAMKIKRTIFILILAFVFFQLGSYADQGGSGNIIIYGDTRTNSFIHQKIVNRIMENNPSVVFHVGDLVNDGFYPKNWSVFNKVTGDLRKKAEFYPVLGNHERNSPLYFKNFNLPNNGRWYSLDRQDVHFIILDSNSILSIGSEQYRWLEDNLKGVDKKTKFIIVIFHHPIFSSTRNCADKKKLRPLIPLFERYGVNMVFNGHAHNYERFLYNKIYYIITGGGGAPLYERSGKAEYSQVFAKVYHFCKLSINGDQLTVTAIDIDANVVDEFSIKSDIH
jgi:3',5'-cyclic AMP phosphodiesterase CpdA